jgi:hypothetical protein
MALSNLDARMIFDNAKVLLDELNAQRMAEGQAPYTVEWAKATQGFLRSEVPMVTNSTNYSIQVIVNQGNPNGRVLNKFMNMQDLFFVSDVFVGWTLASATAVNGKIYTYPNLTAAATGGSIPADLNALYNGQLIIQMNNNTVNPGWDLDRHLFVPRTQQNTAFNVASPTSPAVQPIDQVNLSEDGWYPCEPNMVFNGGGNLNVNLNLAGAIASVPTNAAIVVKFRGLLLQNVSGIK